MRRPIKAPQETLIDDVFTALARLAGRMEADRTLSRAGRLRYRKSPPRKIDIGPLEVRYEETNSSYRTTKEYE